MLSSPFELGCASIKGILKSYRWENPKDGDSDSDRERRILLSLYRVLRIWWT